MTTETTEYETILAAMNDSALDAERIVVEREMVKAKYALEALKFSGWCIVRQIMARNGHAQGISSMRRKLDSHT